MKLRIIDQNREIRPLTLSPSLKTIERGQDLRDFSEDFDQSHRKKLACIDERGQALAQKRRSANTCDLEPLTASLAFFVQFANKRGAVIIGAGFGCGDQDFQTCLRSKKTTRGRHLIRSRE